MYPESFWADQYIHWTHKASPWFMVIRKIFKILPLLVSLFFTCLHFCLLSHLKIFRCFVKSLIATSTYFLLKHNWKKENLKSFFGHQTLGTQTSIMVSQTTWICHCYAPNISPGFTCPSSCEKLPPLISRRKEFLLPDFKV